MLWDVRSDPIVASRFAANVSEMREAELNQLTLTVAPSTSMWNFLSAEVPLVATENRE